MSKVSEHEIAFLTPCCDKGRGLLQDHRWGSPKNPSAMFVLIPGSGFPHVLAISEVHSTKCHLWYLFFSVIWLLISFRQWLQGPKGSPRGRVLDGTEGCRAPSEHHSASKATKHRYWFNGAAVLNSLWSLRVWMLLVMLGNKHSNWNKQYFLYFSSFLCFIFGKTSCWTGTFTEIVTVPGRSLSWQKRGWFFFAVCPLYIFISVCITPWWYSGADSLCFVSPSSPHFVFFEIIV